jgi:hypothetical protein
MLDNLDQSAVTSFTYFATVEVDCFVPAITTSIDFYFSLTLFLWNKKRKKSPDRMTVVVRPNPDFRTKGITKECCENRCDCGVKMWGIL